MLEFDRTKVRRSHNASSPSRKGGRSVTATNQQVYMQLVGVIQVAAIMNRTRTLQEMMSMEADIVLAFSRDNVKETVESHSSIIRLSSPVLDHALELQSSSSSSNSVSSSSSGRSHLRMLPLPGTTKADFLMVAQFLYPVVPLPKVSWGNLEMLLVEGRKWDIRVVLAHAADFLQANASSLDLTPSSSKYAFKWLQLADAARLTDACKACADRIIALDRSSCVSANLQGLSPQTLMYLLDKVATTTAHTSYLGVHSSSSAIFHGTAGAGAHYDAGTAGAGAHYDAGHDIFGIGVAPTYYSFDECYRCARIRAVRTRATYSREGGVRMLRMCDECGRNP